jgi:LDH2 family malate/lactate/ureidoglycolate dehydrogenase
VLAINPRAFADEDAFTGTIDNMAAAVESAPAAPGFPRVLLPGGPEANSRAERSQSGVPVPPDTWDAIGKTAQELGVELPKI